MSTETKKASPQLSMSENGACFEVSKYNDTIATLEKIEFKLQKLRYAFPAQPVQFWAILAERIIEHGFTEQRLSDAIDRAIDKHVYPTLQIADIVGYDRKRVLFAHWQVQRLWQMGYQQDDFDKKMHPTDKTVYWWFKSPTMEKTFLNKAFISPKF